MKLSLYTISDQFFASVALESSTPLFTKFGIFPGLNIIKVRVAIWPFLNVDKNSKFYGLFWTNLSKFQTFYEILNLNLVILTIF
jgi:hypothetical protein